MVIVAVIVAAIVAAEVSVAVAVAVPPVTERHQKLAHRMTHLTAER